MSLLALLVAATPLAPVAPPPEVAQEIVVIGEKLKTWRGTFAKRKGAFICKTTKSSGDRRIDAIRCDAMRWCGMQLDAEAQAIADAPEPKAVRNRKLSALAQRMPPCMKQYEDAAAERLASERVSP